MRPVVRTLSPLAAAAALLLSTPIVSAQPALPAAAVKAAPAAPLQALRAQVERLRAQAVQAGVVDNTPPVLERFAIVGDVKATSAQPKAIADLAIADDLSGLYGYGITLVGPSGQMVSRSQGLETAQLRIDGRLAIGAQIESYAPFTRYTEPGEWKVDSVYFYDNAYNSVYLSGSDLAALGRTTFTVVNDHGHDVVPPDLVRGQVLTPSVSLSTPPAGAYDGRLPFVTATVRGLDTGNGAVAGVNEVMLAFCLLDERNNCMDRMELYGRADVSGDRSATVHVGAEVRADQTPGTYFLYQAYVNDVGLNYHHYYSNRLGGETDFRKMFGNVNIEVTP